MPDTPTSTESDRATTARSESAATKESSPPPRDTDVGDTGPPYDCSYCDRRFHRKSYLALHRGQEHTRELSTADQAAYEEAREEEAEQLRLFRLQALAALVFIYFGFLLVYAFSL
jgi:hypothetical protein